MPRSRGRPSRLTPATAGMLLEAISEGATRSEAMRETGVGASTFYRWMADPRPEYQEFRDAVEREELARDRRKVSAVAMAKVQRDLFRLARRSPLAAIRWLEVNDPELCGLALSRGPRRHSRRARPASVPPTQSTQAPLVTIAIESLSPEFRSWLDAEVARQRSGAAVSGQPEGANFDAPDAEDEFIWGATSEG